MTDRDPQGSDASDPGDRLAQATEWFVRLRADDADIEDLTRFRRWVEESPDNAAAYARVKQSWSAVGDQASTPEIMLGRRDALEDARRAARGRWDPSQARWMRPAVAAVACVLLVVASAVGAWVWWSRANAGVYMTGVGERRTLTLADGRKGQSTMIRDLTPGVRYADSTISNGSTGMIRKTSVSTVSTRSVAPPM